MGSQFKVSLALLIQKMNACQPHFVRCIKPNHQKLPNKYGQDACGLRGEEKRRGEGSGWKCLGLDVTIASGVRTLYSSSVDFHLISA